MSSIFEQSLSEAQPCVTQWLNGYRRAIPPRRHYPRYARIINIQTKPFRALRMPVKFSEAVLCVCQITAIACCDIKQIIALKEALMNVVDSNVESTERGRESLVASAGAPVATSSREALHDVCGHARGRQFGASSFSHMGFQSRTELGT